MRMLERGCDVSKESLLSKIRRVRYGLAAEHFERPDSIIFSFLTDLEQQTNADQLLRTRCSKSIPHR
jgi:hypothetical protein